MSLDNRYFQDEFVRKYICLWAFGYINGFGYSESVYSVISKLSIGEINVSEILDVGCGVGRTAFDLSTIYPTANVKGIDNSEKMIYYAKLLNSGNKVSEEVIRLHGFYDKKMKFPSFNNKNISFEKVSYRSSEASNGRYDIIANVNYLDRCNDVPSSIRSFYSDLKTGGVLIGATPLNFRNGRSFTVNELRAIFCECGFVEEIFFDGLPYFEIMDSRHSGEFYKLICFKYRK